jgi:Na+/melibiose symporter-like transporter
VAAIPLAVLLDVAGIGLLYVVVFAAGVLTVLYQIADFAFLPSIVAKEQLVDANGKISASQSANEIGGRGPGRSADPSGDRAGGGGGQRGRVPGVGLTLRRVRSVQPVELDDAAGPTRTAARREVVEGLRTAVRHRYVRALLGEATTFNVFNEIFILGLLIHALRTLDLGAAEIGLVFTAGGVGSFAGAWFGSSVTARFGYGRVLLITLFVGNTAPIAVAFTGSVGDALAPLLLYAVFVVMGVGIGIANVHAVTLRQTAVPEHLRGRVNAAYRLISWGAIPLGAAAGGLLASQWGAETTMIAGAVGMSLATLWGGLLGGAAAAQHRRRRRSR